MFLSILRLCVLFAAAVASVGAAASHQGDGYLSLPRDTAAPGGESESVYNAKSFQALRSHAEGERMSSAGKTARRWPPFLFATFSAVAVISFFAWRCYRKVVEQTRADGTFHVRRVSDDLQQPSTSTGFCMRGRRRWNTVRAGGYGGYDADWNILESEDIMPNPLWKPLSDMKLLDFKEFAEDVEEKLDEMLEVLPKDEDTRAVRDIANKCKAKCYVFSCQLKFYKNRVKWFLERQGRDEGSVSSPLRQLLQASEKQLESLRSDILRATRQLWPENLGNCTSDEERTSCCVGASAVSERVPKPPAEMVTARVPQAQDSQEGDQQTEGMSDVETDTSDEEDCAACSAVRRPHDLGEQDELVEAKRRKQE